MTWPDGIALATGILAAFLITLHQHHTRNEHRSTTEQHTDPQDGTGERP
ncbi:hypothetical protein AB0G67_40180 [Streptomyces sp. NPDC021056]